MRSPSARSLTGMGGADMKCLSVVGGAVRMASRRVRLVSNKFVAALRRAEKETFRTRARAIYGLVAGILAFPAMALAIYLAARDPNSHPRFIVALSLQAVVICTFAVLFIVGAVRKLRAPSENAGR